MPQLENPEEVTMTKHSRSNSNPNPLGHQRNFNKMEQDRRRRMSRTSTVLRPDPFSHGHPNPLRSNPVFVEEYPPEIQAILRPNPVRVDSSAGLEGPFVLENGKGPRDNLASLAPGANKFVIGQAVTTPADASTAAAFEKPTRNNLVTANLVNSSDRAVPEAHSTVGVDVMEAGASRLGDLEGATDNAAYFSSPSVVDPPATAPAHKEHVNSGLKSNLPSVLSLPRGWNENHDRFICYLETHAPLTRDGQVPENEECIPRYTYRQMLYMLDKKFPEFRSETLSIKSIDTRLQMLELQDNDYFCIPYRGYSHMEWGRDI